MTDSDRIPDAINVAAPRPERRTAARLPCRADLPFRLIVARRYECRWAKALDVSTSGISFLISAPLEEGTAVFLRLRGEPGAAPLTLLAEVVHATSHPDGNWMIGCRFDSVTGDLTGEERLQLQGLFQRGPEGGAGPGPLPQELTAKLYFPFAPVI